MASRDAAHGCSALRRPSERALSQCLPSERVLSQIGLIEPTVDDQLVHQPQRERAIRTGHQRNVLVAFIGRLRLAEVDAYQFGAIALGALCATLQSV